MTGFNDKPTLSFNRVRLEPLTLQHEAGLREAVCDGRLWELAVTSAPAPDQVAAYIQTASATRIHMVCAIRTAHARQYKL